VDQLPRVRIGAVRHAQPARTAAAVLAGTTRTAAVVGPHHAERSDRPAGARGNRRAEAPHLVELVHAAQLDLVPVVVEKDTETFIVGRMVVVLDEVGIGVTRVRVHWTFEVALGLGPDVAEVERPLVVPRAIELELARLVRAVLLLVAP